MKIKNHQSLADLEEQLLKTYNEKDLIDLKYIIDKVKKVCKDKNINHKNFIVTKEYFYQLIFLRDNEESLIKFLKDNSEYTQDGWLVEFLPKGGADSKFFIEQKNSETKEEAFKNLVEFLRNNFYLMQSRKNISIDYEINSTRERVSSKQEDHSMA